MYFLTNPILPLSMSHGIKWHNWYWLKMKKIVVIIFFIDCFTRTNKQVTLTYLCNWLVRTLEFQLVYTLVCWLTIGSSLWHWPFTSTTANSYTIYDESYNDKDKVINNGINGCAINLKRLSYLVSRKPLNQISMIWDM